ncbi:MAG: phosphoribosylformylglycinamidine cyclo-ligase [Anaerolineae bacterium]|nr:phosphoribosylformylglycinamidine cyclo-ligase [Anaerolineae bacterium]
MMREAVQKTYTPEVLGGIGAFGGSISVQSLAQHNDLVLVSSTDGVGTKTLIATEMGTFDTIGHDIVNHCVNDILVQGARPLLFLDYIASSKLNPELIAAVVSGCAEACQKVGCVLIGGETAEMPGVYEPGSLDLVGTMVGWVDRSQLLDGSTVTAGDVCLGLPSSGLHTNGFSLARRVLGTIGWHTVLPEFGHPLGEVLLTPHRAYLPEVEDLWHAGITIKAMAHLTGGSFIENLPRVLPTGTGVAIDRSSWKVPLIFQLIQDMGQVQDQEMFRVFNMGIGMILMVDAETASKAVNIVPEARIIGTIKTWDGTSPRVIIQD